MPSLVLALFPDRAIWKENTLQTGASQNVVLFIHCRKKYSLRLVRLWLEEV